MAARDEVGADALTIVCPLGRPLSGAGPKKDARVRSRGARPVLGIIDNGKPNVAQFLQGMAAAAAMGVAEFDVLSVVKPRSAAACPDLDRLIGRCDLVINAVAD